MCCCKQQTAECPYTFMGIPLDVTTEEFNLKLKEKGFTEKGLGIFTGVFFGYPCTVGSSLYGQKPVNHVTVFINDVFDAFNDIKEALMKKYSDTAKWRYIDDANNYRVFHIFSTDDDIHCYIQLVSLNNLIEIDYFNVEQYKDPDNIDNDRMQDL